MELILILGCVYPLEDTKLEDKKFCECGCGAEINQTKRFKHGHYVKLNPRKADNSNFWTGGRRKDSSGYVLIHSPAHPSATKAGYVCEHRLVMEKHLGRYLTEDEHIHHINQNPKDNRLENLKIMSNSEHIRFHRTEELKRGINRFTYNK
jgi:HNH endonuclease.